MSTLEMSPKSDSNTSTGANLWYRQLRAVIGIEIGKSLFSRGAIIPYVLAIIPVLLTIIIAIADDHGEPITGNIDGARRIYAIIYSGFVLGAVVFLGSAAIFTTLFRGEILNKSMHYYLLSPIRREILVGGKFLAGLVAAISLFGVATVVSYTFMYLPFGLDQLIRDLASGLLITQLFAYLGITFLGCVGYGSLFLVTGLLFRNPLFPVVVVAGWEMIHFLLPPAFKIFSVIYYLKGLMPIPLDEGPLAVLVTPPSVWVSMAGICGLAAVSLCIAIVFLKRLSLTYSED